MRTLTTLLLFTWQPLARLKKLLEQWKILCLRLRVTNVYFLGTVSCVCMHVCVCMCVGVCTMRTIMHQYTFSCMSVLPSQAHKGSIIEQPEELRDDLRLQGLSTKMVHVRIFKIYPNLSCCWTDYIAYHHGYIPSINLRHMHHTGTLYWGHGVMSEMWNHVLKNAWTPIYSYTFSICVCLFIVPLIFSIISWADRFLSHVRTRSSSNKKNSIRENFQMTLLRGMQWIRLSCRSPLILSR